MCMTYFPGAGIGLTVMHYAEALADEMPGRVIGIIPDLEGTITAVMSIL